MNRAIRPPPRVDPYGPPRSYDPSPKGGQYNRQAVPMQVFPMDNLVRPQYNAQAPQPHGGVDAGGFRVDPKPMPSHAAYQPARRPSYNEQRDLAKQASEDSISKVPADDLAKMSTAEFDAAVKEEMRRLEKGLFDMMKKEGYTDDVVGKEQNGGYMDKYDKQYDAPRQQPARGIDYPPIESNEDLYRERYRQQVQASPGVPMAGGKADPIGDYVSHVNRGINDVAYQRQVSSNDPAAAQANGDAYAREVLKMREERRLRQEKYKHDLDKDLARKKASPEHQRNRKSVSPEERRPSNPPFGYPGHVKPIYENDQNPPSPRQRYMNPLNPPVSPTYVRAKQDLYSGNAAAAQYVPYTDPRWRPSGKNAIDAKQRDLQREQKAALDLQIEESRRRKEEAKRKEKEEDARQEQRYRAEMQALEEEKEKEKREQRARAAQLLREEEALRGKQEAEALARKNRVGGAHHTPMQQKDSVSPHAEGHSPSGERDGRLGGRVEAGIPSDYPVWQSQPSNLERIDSQDILDPAQGLMAADPYNQASPVRGGYPYDYPQQPPAPMPYGYGQHAQQYPPAGHAQMQPGAYPPAANHAGYYMPGNSLDPALHPPLPDPYRVQGQHGAYPPPMGDGPGALEPIPEQGGYYRGAGGAPAGYENMPRGEKVSPKRARARLVDDVYGSAGIRANDVALDEKWRPSGKNAVDAKMRDAQIEQKAVLERQIEESRRRKEEAKKKEKEEDARQEQRYRAELRALEEEQEREKQKKKALASEQLKQEEMLRVKLEIEAKQRKGKLSKQGNAQPDRKSPKVPLEDGRVSRESAFDAPPAVPRKGKKGDKRRSKYRDSEADLGERVDGYERGDDAEYNYRNRKHPSPQERDREIYHQEERRIREMRMHEDRYVRKSGASDYSRRSKDYMQRQDSNDEYDDILSQWQKNWNGDIDSRLSAIRNSLDKAHERERLRGEDDVRQSQYQRMRPRQSVELDHASAYLPYDRQPNFNVHANRPLPPQQVGSSFDPHDVSFVSDSRFVHGSNEFAGFLSMLGKQQPQYSTYEPRNQQPSYPKPAPVQGRLPVGQSQGETAVEESLQGESLMLYVGSAKDRPPTSVSKPNESPLAAAVREQDDKAFAAREAVKYAQHNSINVPPPLEEKDSVDIAMEEKDGKEKVPSRTGSRRGSRESVGGAMGFMKNIFGRKDKEKKESVEVEPSADAKDEQDSFEALVRKGSKQAVQAVDVETQITDRVQSAKEVIDTGTQMTDRPKSSAKAPVVVEVPAPRPPMNNADTQTSRNSTAVSGLAADPLFDPRAFMSPPVDTSAVATQTSKPSTGASINKIGSFQKRGIQSEDSYGGSRGSKPSVSDHSRALLHQQSERSMYSRDDDTSTGGDVVEAGVSRGSKPSVSDQSRALLHEQSEKSMYTRDEDMSAGGDGEGDEAEIVVMPSLSSENLKKSAAEYKHPRSANSARSSIPEVAPQDPFDISESMRDGLSDDSSQSPGSKPSSSIISHRSRKSRQKSRGRYANDSTSPDKYDNFNAGTSSSQAFRKDTSSQSRLAGRGNVSSSEEYASDFNDSTEILTTNGVMTAGLASESKVKEMKQMYDSKDAKDAKDAKDVQVSRHRRNSRMSMPAVAPVDNNLVIDEYYTGAETERSNVSYAKNTVASEPSRG